MGRILFLAWMLFAITKLSDMAMRKIFFLAIMCFLLPRAANAATYDLAQAVAQADAPKIYICNIMTQDGETEGYTAADHLEALLVHGARGCWTCAWPTPPRSTPDCWKSIGRRTPSL